MAKYYGKIGFAEPVEVRPGVWKEEITEYEYAGDFNRNTRRLQSYSKVNDDIDISNEISILADPYASAHFHNMRYATYNGSKWKITDVTVEFPRLILSLGGLFNG